MDQATSVAGHPRVHNRDEWDIIEFLVNDSGTERSVVMTDASLGGWHHVAGVADATSTRIYLDGTLVNSEPGVASGIQYSPQSVLRIGANLIGNSFNIVQGVFDEVTIYSRALSDTEIKRIARSGLGGKGNTLPSFVSYGDLTLPSNSQAHDLGALLHVSDVDPGQTLYWVEDGGRLPAYGTLNINSPSTITPSGGTDIAPNGTLTYTPASDYAGTDQFGVFVSDGLDIGYRIVSVNLVNSAVEFIGDSALTLEVSAEGTDIRHLLRVMELDADQTLTWSEFSPPSHGVLTFVDARATSTSAEITPGGMITYTPDPGFCCLDSFVVQVTDGVETVTRTISVSLENDSPLFVGEVTSFEFPYNDPPRDVRELLHASDPNPGQTLTWSQAIAPLFGTLTITDTTAISGGPDVAPGGSVIYTPAPNDYRADVFTIRVSDGVSSATRSVHVSFINSAPEFVGTTDDINVSVSAPVYDLRDLLHVSDINDGQVLTWSLDAHPRHGTLTINAATALSGGSDITPGGMLTYVPFPGFGGSDDFRIRVTDGHDHTTKTISVHVANVPPSFVGSTDSISVPENSVDIDIKSLLHASDNDPDQTLRWSESLPPGHGELGIFYASAPSGSNDIVPGGTLRYTPDTGYFGADTFTVKLTDGIDSSDRTIRVGTFADLTASDAEVGDELGWSVAVSGDTALVAARGESGVKGAVYVYERTGNGWVEQAKLTASDGAATDRFGDQVALDGDFALVGAPEADVNGVINDGAAYVFVRSGTTWSQQAKLTIGESTAGGRNFGRAVALGGNTAVVGAIGAPAGGIIGAGAAYMFERNGDTWTQALKLTATDAAQFASFGSGLSLDKDTLLVGAGTADVPGKSGAGAAYIFVRNGTSWSEEAKIWASDPEHSSAFGAAGSVSLSGDTAVIGTNFHKESVYVFVRNGTSWSQEAKLALVDPDVRDFGISVAVSGDAALIGANQSTVNNALNAGAAYLFTRNEGVWTQKQRLTSGNPGSNNGFGNSVALDWPIAAVGERNSMSGTGAAYMFAFGELNTPPAFLDTDTSLVVTSPFGWDVSNLLRARDPDHGEILTWSQEVAPNHGTLTFSSPTAPSGDAVISPEGSIFYTPSPNYNGADNFTVRVSDGTNRALRSISVSVELPIRYVDSPGLLDLSPNTPATDIKHLLHVEAANSGQTLTWSLSSAPSHGTVQISNATAASGGNDIIPGGTIAYEPEDGYEGPDSFTIQVSNGIDYAFQTISVNIALMAPEFVGGNDLLELEANSSSIDLADLLHIHDRDLDQTLTWSEHTPPSHGALSFSDAMASSGGVDIPPGGIIAYTPNTDYFGPDAFTVQVTDGIAIASRTISVFVNVDQLYSVAQGNLTAADSAENDNLGFSVAVSGDTALVGARGVSAETGAAYVYVRDGSSWTEQAKLTVADVAPGQRFGNAVALSGDTALVGTEGANAAYIFERTGATWTLNATLTVPSSQGFGASVALIGDTAVVGASGTTVDSKLGAGRAYLFIRIDGVWILGLDLQANDPEQYAGFGTGVALDLNPFTVAVGAGGAESSGVGGAGAVHVFALGEHGLYEQAKLFASDPINSSHFGASGTIGLDGDTLLIGGTFTQAAYVFQRTGDTWSQPTKLVADDPQSLNFGRSVALSGGAALIGANRASPDDLDGAGAAYLFKSDGDTWTKIKRLTGGDRLANDFFGFSVAMNGMTAVVGAPTATRGGNFGSGQAYLYDSVFDEPPNIVPSFVDSPGTLSVGRNGLPTEIDDLLTVSDQDEGQTLTWTEGTPPSYGSLNFSDATAQSGRTDIRMDGTVTYTPDPDFEGTDSFTVQVSDSVGTGTQTIPVNITIGGGGAFSVPADSMAAARHGHSATLLTDGRILIAGGNNGLAQQASAELFDPITRTFSDAGSLLDARANHTATLLLTGKVLITGGDGSNGRVRSAELYDPVTGLFTPAGNISIERAHHTATLLPSGKVLVAGGISQSGTHIQTADLYDPDNGNITWIGNMLNAHSFHTSTLLSDGNVLVVGGINGSYSKDAELYDPVTRTFTATGGLAEERAFHSATLMTDGKVLVTGGERSGGYISSAELYDPGSGIFSSAGQMSAPRYDAPAVLLGNGKVLIAGGINLASTDVYDPVSGSFSPGASMTVARQGATASLFADGMVLLAGGLSRTSAELYLGEETGNYLPLFVEYDTTIEVDANATSVDIGGLLHGNDRNTDQTLTWSEKSAPSHGVLNFSGATTSSGSTDIAPPAGAITYTPTPGYVGPDSFVIQVSDGIATTPRTVDVTIEVKPLFTIQEAKLDLGGGANYFFGSAVALSGDAALVALGSGGILTYERVSGSWASSGGLSSLDLAHGDRFGFSIALSGDTALVGARDADVNGVVNDGAAYVFVRSGNTWSQQAKLTLDEPTSGGRGFGAAVALEGDRAVVGNNGSAAYVFERNGGVWIQVAKLTASDTAPGFGASVALDGDTVIVGGGAAYVFVRDGSGWTQQAKLVSSEPSAAYGFAALGSIGLSGNTAIIGASGRATVYVFERTGTSWAEKASLTAEDPESNPASFGAAVALSGNWAVIGDRDSSPDRTPAAGAVYVLERAGTVWTRRDRLTAADAGQFANFGNSVALSENTVLVGARAATVSGASNAGAAYAFTVPDTVLTFVGKPEPFVLTANASPTDVKGGLHVSNSDTGQIIAWSQYSAPTHGDLSFVDAIAASGSTDIEPGGTITYTPHTGYAGSDQFTIQAADGTDSARRTILVTVENTAPTFDAGSVSLFVDLDSQPTDIKPYLHASDIDGDQTLSWAQSSSPSHGTLVISGATASSGGTDITPGGTITYTPDTGYVGPDSFVVQVSDGVVTTERTILLAVGNVAPTFVRVSSSFSIFPDGPTKDIKSLLRVSDTDTDQTLTWSQSSAPGKGSLNISGATALSGGTDITPGGSITYTPTPGSTGADSFVVQVTDGINTTTRTVSVHFLGEQGKLVAGEPDFGETLGWSVAVSGNTALVGARGSMGSQAGKAYVYVLDGGAWTQQAVLTGSDVAGGQRFGQAVALDGDTALVGTDGANAVYVFVRNGSSWSQETKLTADGASGFGDSFVVKGDTALVGAPHTTGGGVVYEFERNGATWTLKAELRAADLANYVGFGSGLAMDGDTLVVGARGAEVQGAVASGAAYVLVRNGTTWNHQAKFWPSDPAPYSGFGLSGAVSVFGDTAVIGRNGNEAYVFVRNGASWSQQARLTSGDPQAGAFGLSVAVFGETALIGAYPSNPDGVGGAGAAYLFTRDGNVWTKQDRITANDKVGTAYFGWSVALDGTTAVVGARNVTVGDRWGAGAAYVYGLEEVNIPPSFVGGTTTLNLGVNEPETDIKGLFHVSDRDIDQVLTWTATSVPSHGTLDISGTTASSGGTDIPPGGAITYTAATGYVGVDSFTVQASDGAATATRTISVTIANTAPTFVSETTSFKVPPEGSAKDIKPLLHVSDTDTGQTLTWSQGSAPSKGSLSFSGTAASTGGSDITPGGTITYTPTSGQAGADSFTVQVTDGAATITRSISLNITREQGKLVAGEPDFGESLGWSVAVSGNTAVVGARGSMGSQAGKAYVYVLNEGAWTQQALLTGSDVTGGQRFGQVVALDGDTALVGTDGANAVYVFVRNGSNWSQEAKLTADGASGFGASVVVKGDTALVGAPATSLDGVVYEFERNGGTWTLKAQLRAADSVNYLNFGSGMAMDGDTLVVGAIGANVPGAANSGAAYVLVRNGTTWNHQAKFWPSDPAAGSAFGLSGAVSVFGDTAVIGRSGNEAYVFVRNGTAWSQQARLTAGDPQSGAFGRSVAVYGETALIGDWGANPDGVGGAGAAYLFTRDGNVWTKQDRLTASDKASTAYFGWSVAFEGTTAVVGARNVTVGDRWGGGAAYVFGFEMPNRPPTFVDTTSSLSVGPNSPSVDLKNLLHIRDTNAGQTLTWSEDSPPSHGIVSISNATAASGGIDITPGGTITYTPDTGYTGSDEFIVQVSDGTEISRRTIRVTIQNITPTFVGSTQLLVDQGSPPTDLKPYLRANDSDGGQTLTWAQNSPPSHGTLFIFDATAASGGTDITPDGMMTYTPAAGYFGSDSFAVQVDDGTSTSVRTITVTIIQDVALVTGTGSMSNNRNGQTATLLTNGKVLMVGGYNGSVLATAELYDPSSGTFSATGSTSDSRWTQTATLLANGKVLVVGGHSGSSLLASAELYDPSNGLFTPTGNLAQGRSSHTATLLANGKVLIAGGEGHGGRMTDSELYDPVSGSFSATGNMIEGRSLATATLLASGKVLVVGGRGGTIGYPTFAELYDPITGTFTATGNLAVGRWYHTATGLANGKVLVAGGETSGAYLTSAELYDPNSGTFFSAGNMSAIRFNSVAVLLSSGKVLVAGGGVPSVSASTELYDPVSGTFSPGLSMTVPRQNARATLFENGKVLISGGYGGSQSGHLSSAELYFGERIQYTPPKPTLSSLSPSEIVGGTGEFSLTLEGSDFNPTSIVLWNNNPLSTTFVSDSSLTAQVPSGLVPTTDAVIAALVMVENPGVGESASEAFTVKAANVGPVQTEVSEPGETIVAQVIPTTPNEPGVAASFSNQTPGSSPATVTAAVYTSNPVAGTTIDTGAGVVDLQITGADPSDAAAVNFYYNSTVSGITEQDLILRFYDGMAWVPLLSSGGASPVKNTTDNLDGSVSGGRFTVVFDDTSTPRVTELDGTFIAMAPNDAPTANPDAFIVGEGDVLSVTAPGVLSNDTDPNDDALLAVLVNGPSRGSLALQANGAFTYTPLANYSGPDSFSYKANDTADDSEVTTVSITVTPITPVPGEAVSWWNADNNANDLLDGNNGTLQNGATTAAGLVGQAFRLDGVDDYVRIPNAPNLNFGSTGDFTVEAWVKLNGDQPDFAGIFVKGELPYPGRWVQFVVVNNRVAAEIISGGFAFVGVNDGLIGTTSLNNGAWNHVSLVVTRSSQNAKLYVNGSLEADVTNSVIGGDLSNSIDAVIGVSRDFSRYFKGDIDEVTIYNRALPQSELQAIVTAKSAGKIAPAPFVGDFVSWWKAEGDGEDSADGNNGTLQNGVTFGSGRVGQAFNLDGVDDYVNVPNAPNLDVGTSVDFSVEGWLKLNGAQPNFAGILAKMEDGTVGHKGFQLILVDNKLAAEFYNAFGFVGSGNGLIGTTDLADDRWHHVALAVTRSSANAKLYVDGAVEADVNHPAVSGGLSNGFSLKIGAERTLKAFFKGSLDELTFYARTLGSSEIQGIVAAGPAGKTPPPNVSPIAQCQDVIVSADANCSANASIDNGSYDPDAGDTITLTQTPPGPYPIGETQVTLTVTDSYGVTDSCTATVTVVDDTPPVVVAQDITVFLDASGNATINPSTIDNDSSDNCGVANLSLDLTTFTCANVGANSVTLTVTDVNGNSATADVVVTVSDIIAPIAEARSITVQLDGTGQATITPAQIDSGSGDACGIASLSLNLTDFTCSNVGANPVVLTVTDNNGNTSTANAVVTVEDNVPPIAKARNITVQLDAAGQVTITPAQIDNGSSDNCAIENLALDVTSFSCANIGLNTVNLTVTDVNGNSSTVAAEVKVEDNVLPTALTQNITVQLDSDGNASITATDIDNGSHDACGISSLSLDDTLFTCADVGANLVTLTVTDNNGNVSSATATVTVEDNVAPIALAKDITVQLNAAGNVSITSGDVDDGSNDACGIASLSVSPNTFECGNVGANTVTLTVTDNHGNISSTTATVTVEDNVPPIAAVRNLTIQLDAEGNASITPTDIDKDSNDACGIADLSLDITSFSAADLGANIVKLTVTDVNGNTATATATVTLEDNIPPVIAQPADISKNNDIGECGAVVEFNISATDNSAGSSAPSAIAYQVAGGTIGNQNYGGALGNDFDVNEPIEITRLGVFDSGSNGLATTLKAYVYDRKNPASPLATLTFTPANSGVLIEGSRFLELASPLALPAGFQGTIVADGYSASEQLGNSFYPLPLSTDDGGGLISFVGTGRFGTDAGSFPASLNSASAYSYAAGTFEFKATGSPGFTTVSSPASGSFFPVGTTEVTSTVTDGSGNASVATFNVTVVDNEAPVVACRDIVVELDATGNASITAQDLDDSSIDNCGIASLAIDRDSFSCADVGILQVTLTVTDIHGNKASCVANVEVIDTVPPVVAVQNITALLDSLGAATIVPSAIDNGSSDACGIANLSLDKTSFGCADVGDNIVTLTVTDVNGNSSQATATVTVIDLVPPLALTKDITVQLDDNGNASITAGNIDNGSNDACGIASLSASHNSFTCANVGANTVTLTVTDNNGNVSIATATVTVEDNVAPVAKAQNITVQLDVDGNASITAGNIDNGSNDACGISSLSVSPNSFSCANVGANTVTLTVADNNGNVSTVTAIVTVEDNVAPVAIAQNITVQLDVDGNASITPGDIDNGSNDACGIASLSLDKTSFGCADAGDNTVTLTVTDVNGNVSTATAIVTVEDNIPPAITCPEDLVVECDGLGNVTELQDWLDSVTASDACGVTISNDFTTLSDDCGATGTALVTFTAIDSNGNVSICQASFTIVDTTAPTLSSDAQDISPNETPITFTVNSSDICGDVTIELATTCHAINGAGKIVDKSDGCVINIDGNLVTIVESGGTGNIITIFATSTDDCGNSTSTEFVVNVLNPGNGKGNDGSNDDDEPGTSPGNGGGKGKKN